MIILILEYYLEYKWWITDVLLLIAIKKLILKFKIAKNLIVISTKQNEK